MYQTECKTDYQNKVLKNFYSLVYPPELNQNEFIRICCKTSSGAIINKYVRNFAEFQAEIYSLRFQGDVWCSISTNKGSTYSRAENQQRRQVVFLDFDFKNIADLPLDRESRPTFLKQKIFAAIPNLFIAAMIDSGHGIHAYVLTEETTDIDRITEINKDIAELCGADLNACKKTQMCRVPCTYNFKDYTGEGAERKLPFVTVIYNNAFKTYPLPLLSLESKVKKSRVVMADAAKPKRNTAENKCFFCIKSIEESGVDKGLRNKALGRIVKMYQMQGQPEAAILHKALEFNEKCRPPKAETEIKADVKAFMGCDYNLLGCWQSVPDLAERELVRANCDPYQCKTAAGSPQISATTKYIDIPCGALTNKILQTLDGIDLLLLTVTKMFDRGSGLDLGKLREKLTNPKTKKLCFDERTFKKHINGLSENKYITVKNGKISLSNKFCKKNEQIINLSWNAARAFILKEINGTAYTVYIALVRNLQTQRKVTYEQLSEDLKLDKAQIKRSIKLLEEYLLIDIRKQFTESGTTYNFYYLQ